jgi:hypothetical protein
MSKYDKLYEWKSSDLLNLWNYLPDSKKTENGYTGSPENRTARTRAYDILDRRGTLSSEDAKTTFKKDEPGVKPTLQGDNPYRRTHGLASPSRSGTGFRV